MTQLTQDKRVDWNGLELEVKGIALANSATIDLDSGTATAVAGAVTLNQMAGIITSEALSTAAGATYTLTITNSAIAATDLVMVSVSAATSAGTPAVTSVKPAAGSVVIIIQNVHASAAFNAAIKISFITFKP